MTSLIIIIISIIFSAFFSGMEIAFVSSNKLRVEIDKKQRKFSSRIVGYFMKYPSRYISTMLVGNNIALVIYGIAFAKLLERPIENLLTVESEVLVLLIQTILSTLIILLTAEFLPKTLFRLNPNNALRFFSIPILFFYIVLYPISLISIAISNFIMQYILGMPSDRLRTEPVFKKVDLTHFVLESQPEQSVSEIEVRDLKIFQNALEFSKLKVRDCMIPRTDVAAVEEESPLDELLQKFIDTGFSRVLIYEESIDHVIGYVNSKDMFRKPEQVKDHLNDIHIVPETLPVNKLFKKFIKEGKNIALVVDEFGGTSGLVTAEDIIEEIFGEIQDEHDMTDLVEKKLDDRNYLFSGRLEIDYLNEKYFLNLPESEEYDTLAGYIIYHYESIPKKNTTLQIDKFYFKVTKVSSNKVELVEMTLLEG
jgi:CBS domain containing-hemolysin-like protein